MSLNDVHKDLFHLVIQVCLQKQCYTCTFSIQFFILACIFKSVFEISKSFIELMTTTCHTQDFLVQAATRVVSSFLFQACLTLARTWVVCKVAH